MNLVEGLAFQIKRATEIRENFLSIGPAGQIGSAFIQADIEQAIRIMGSGDIVAMLQIYKKLEEISE